MSNPIIVLPAGSAARAEFKELLEIPKRVYFVILGNGPEHKEAAAIAKDTSLDWRFTIWAKEPDDIESVLSTLGTVPGDAIGVFLSFDNKIVASVNIADDFEISDAFAQAEVK